MNVPLFKIFWDNDDLSAISNVIRAGKSWATGSNIELFEKKIAHYIGTKYALVVNSGTSALHLALNSHGIKKNDEIIVPSFTFIATCNAPFFVGAKPVFADVECKTFGLDPDDVKKKLTPKTKAIIPIHYGGCPCLIEDLKEIAEDNNLFLIEDCAESFGASIGGKKTGNFGTQGVLSFCQNKIITTGEGGAIVTNSKEIFENTKLARSHGRLENKDYFCSDEYMDYVGLGYNFRMSNINAALGISQIEKIDKIIAMRRKNANYMTSLLSELDGLEVPSVPRDFFHVFQLFTVRIKKGRKVRNSLIRHLKKNHISSKVYFEPVHKTSFYRKMFSCNNIKLPVTEELSDQVLTLPLYPNQTDEEMDYVVNSIKSFFKKN